MFKKILLGIVLNGLALFVVAKFLENYQSISIQYTGGFMFFLIGGVIIGVLNTFVKPLMKLLSFPIVLLTAGLFSFVINVIIFWLTIKVVNGIHFSDVTVTVSSIWTYFIAALVFGLINWILHILVPNK
jgi:putative membrane protein